MTVLADDLDKQILGPGTVTVDAEGRRIEAHVVDADRFGVVVERLRVDGAPGDAATRANDLVENLRPGGQRLVPLEIDPRLGGGVLRTPAEEMSEGRYFQVEVDAQGAELSRHRVDPTGGRAPEPFTVTREQLGSIVDTMAGRASKKPG
jgi:hypothetical protein